MAILSRTVSLARYRVDGKLKEPLMETVTEGLKRYAISAVEDDMSNKSIGWTAFHTPYQPGFDGSSFAVGKYFVFSLRLDKKTVPAKTIKKYCAIEEAKRLAKSGREYLSRQEREMIEDQVVNTLAMRIPAVPNVYDLVWDYESATLWFFTTLKEANEELESLFLRSFKVPLIRLFPYTLADLVLNLSDARRDRLHNLTATHFLE
jgi:DNA recombination-dependent growth factor C